jgi:hypothetical protein
LLGSHALAEAFLQSPEGTLITQGHFYDFSSVFFYTQRTGLLSTDRRVNLEYGSYAPGAVKVFINDSELADLWSGEGRCYLFVVDGAIPSYESIVGVSHMYMVATRGGKSLYTNQPLTSKVAAGGGS